MVYIRRREGVGMGAIFERLVRCIKNQSRIQSPSSQHPSSPKTQCTNLIFFPQFRARKNLLYLLQLNQLEDIKNAILEKYCIIIQGVYRTYRLRKKFLQIRKGSLASRSTVLSYLYLLFRFD